MSLLARERAVGLRGLADLAFAWRDGRTRLTRSRTLSPLAVQRTLYLDDEVPDLATAYLANTSAGILEGDRLETWVSVETGARVRLLTPSATKVYTMAEGEARQDTHLNVAAGGLLEYLPEPLIPFRGARFRQTTTLTVARGGRLIYRDVMMPGRVGHGEALEYACYEHRLTLRDAMGLPLYHGAIHLTPHDLSLQRLGVQGRAAPAVFGTLLAVTSGAAPDLLTRALAAVQDFRATSAVHRLPLGEGFVVKVTANEAQLVCDVLDAAAVQLRHI